MNQIQENKDNFEASIDLADIFNFLKRNAKFIFLTIVTSSVIGSIYSLNLKRVWQGEFQIVVEDNSNIKNPPKGVAGLFAGFSNDEMNTQVGILKSPSVLLPIFNYHNQINPQTDLKYKDWVNNLFIKLEDNSRILTIKYEDTNKEIILPILRKLSNTYQKFSDINKKKDLEGNYKNISKQVELYKQKRDKSLKRLNNFAIENDLEIPAQNNPNFSNEKIRIGAISEIRDIDKQIERLNAAKKLDIDLLYYQLSTIDLIQDLDLKKELEELNQDLMSRKQFFKGSDKITKNLMQQKSLLVNELFNVVLIKLDTQRSKLKSRAEAASRPKDVLIEFNQLIANSELDAFVLRDLEKLKNLTFIEKSEDSKSWRLVTIPTLQDDPVAPSRKAVTAFIVFCFLILGFIFLYFKERNTNIIYNGKYFQELFIKEKIYTLALDEDNYFESVIFNLFKKNISTKAESISILHDVDVDINILNKVKETLQKCNLDNLRIDLTSNVNSCNDNIIFVSQLGFSKRKSVESIYKLIKLRDFKYINFLNIT